MSPLGRLPSRRNAALAIAACAALTALGCRTTAASGSAVPAEGGAAAAPPGDSGPIELFSWWARVGDSNALEALASEHRRRNPGDVLINATAELSGLARSTLRKRMQRDEPPDTFQANAGKDLMQWVVVNGIDDQESKLLPLDDRIGDVATWRKAVPRSVLDQLSYNGKLYGVPSNIHRLNTMFYNKAVFRNFGLSEPKTIDDLKALGRRLAGSGVPLFAIGSREPWTLALVAFECLLVAREGPSFYEGYFKGQFKADDPRVVADLKAFIDLLAFANEDHSRLTWHQAVDLVVRGKAAMTIMGDWARGSFTSHGFKMDEDYGEMAFPQSEETFVFTSDAFPLPIHAKNRAGAERLLRTIGSIEGQLAVNGTRDSLSARMDAPPPVDPTLARKYALFKRGPLVLALSGLVPSRFADDLATSLAEVADEHDVEPAIQTLRSRYALLK
jgi:glucose/mannose transport system substrate-binding protein